MSSANSASATIRKVTEALLNTPAVDLGNAKANAKGTDDKTDAIVQGILKWASSLRSASHQHAEIGTRLAKDCTQLHDEFEALLGSLGVQVWF